MPPIPATPGSGNTPLPLRCSTNVSPSPGVVVATKRNCTVKRSTLNGAGSHTALPVLGTPGAPSAAGSGMRSGLEGNEPTPAKVAAPTSMDAGLENVLPAHATTGTAERTRPHTNSSPAAMPL